MERRYFLRLLVAAALTVGLMLGGCTSKDVLDGTTWESSAQEEQEGGF
jgi:outer membrane lipoprotein SlyB